MKILLYVAVGLGCLVLTGCFESLGRVSSIDQSTVCRFNDTEAAKQCKHGQLAFFQPERFGNEQLPLMVAATYCDFSHPIIHNAGGVVCVLFAHRQ